MSILLPAKAENGDYEMIAPGTYAARCYGIADIGSQLTTFGVKHQIMFFWEFPTELMQRGTNAGKPFVISAVYNLTSGGGGKKSAMVKMLESWRGQPFSEEDYKNFEIGRVLGVPCLIGVVHNENADKNRTYANISSIMLVPKGMEVSGGINERFYFTFNPYSNSEFEKMPEWVREKVKKSPEYAETFQVNHNAEPLDPNAMPSDGIPF